MTKTIMALAVLLVASNTQAAADSYRTPGPNGFEPFSRRGVMSDWSPYSNDTQHYRLMVAGSAIAGAAAGVVVSRVADGSTGWRWTKTDTILELTFVALTTVDCMQTSWFRARGFVEENPLLGPTPSQRDIDIGIGAAVLGHLMVAAALPKPYRSAWQGMGIGVEISAVTWNKSLGVSLKLPW